MVFNMANRYRVNFITTQGKRSGYENVDTNTIQGAISTVINGLPEEFGEVINVSAMKLKELESND